MMKYSMMSYTIAKGEWGKNPDIPALCRLTQELKLEGVDWVSLYGREASEVRRIMDDHGLKTVCYTFGVDINFPDKVQRGAGLDEIEKGIEIASILGTDKIMLPIGGKEGLSREESRKNVIAGLKDAVEIGRKYNVTVTVEHFPAASGPFVTSTDVDEAIREIPELGVTFDSGNVMTGGESPADGFLNNREKIIHVHFKDYEHDDEGMQGLDGNKYRGALIGEGLVDYPTLLATMRDSNYDGYINIEYEGHKYTPEDATRKALEYLRGLEA